MGIDLSSQRIHEILTRKRVQYFHHANTVTSARSFISADGLLSRQRVQDLGMAQTSQRSDATDVMFGIHNHIFLDGLDLSAYYNTPNVYGPVMFKYSIDLLLRPEIPSVRITKENPWYWNDRMRDDEKYYISEVAFEQDYLAGNKIRDGKICFTLSTCDGFLPFSCGLRQIFVDDPGKQDNGVDEIDLVRDRLFENLIAFKTKYPEVAVYKYPRHRLAYQSLSDQEFSKKFRLSIA